MRKKGFLFSYPTRFAKHKAKTLGILLSKTFMFPILIRNAKLFILEYVLGNLEFGIPKEASWNIKSEIGEIEVLGKILCLFAYASA